MKVRRVLLTSKTTLFEMPGLERRDPRLSALLKAGDPLVSRIESSHRETVQARRIVQETLLASGIQVSGMQRLGHIPNGRYDLVITIGGDGTVLDIARFLNRTPVLAVNSSPSSSYGHFTCVQAEALAGLLERIQRDEVEPVELARIRMVVDGRRHIQPILNDVLVADTVPSTTSRYVIRIGNAEEEQKSSGVWVSTAAGSTGAQLSAGGQPMDIRDTRLQYKVREPCLQGLPAQHWKLLDGVLDGPVTLVSRMIRGGAFLDGRRVAVPLRYGTKVDMSPDGPPLRIYLQNGRARMGRA